MVSPKMKEKEFLRINVRDLQVRVGDSFPLYALGSLIQKDLAPPELLQLADNDNITTKVRVHGKEYRKFMVETVTRLVPETLVRGPGEPAPIIRDAGSMIIDPAKEKLHEDVLSAKGKTGVEATVVDNLKKAAEEDNDKKKVLDDTKIKPARHSKKKK